MPGYTVNRIALPKLEFMTGLSRPFLGSRTVWPHTSRSGDHALFGRGLMDEAPTSSGLNGGPLDT